MIKIIGKIPPPTGGVTIHVKRLINTLDQRNLDYEFIINNKRNLLLSIFKIFGAKIHVHSSNPYVRFYYVILSKLLYAKCIVTIHGNLDRYSSKVKNYLDKLTIKYAHLPILLNKESFNKAQLINNKSRLISSFIPSTFDNNLNNKIKSKLQEIKTEYDKIFCTNASNLSYDKEGNDTYGIFEILDYFTVNNKYALVFSDPSGCYGKLIKEKKKSLSSNIYCIQEPHSYYEILKMSDASIRNTTTDGDSLSVKESIYLNKKTFCTDVVSRPQEAILYKQGNLKQVINEVEWEKQVFQKNNKNKIKNGADQLIEIYKND